MSPLGSYNDLLAHAQADSAVCSGCSGRAQDVLRHAQEGSPSAQVKAAAAHVQTLKQNQRKKKLSLTLVVDNIQRMLITKLLRVALLSLLFPLISLARFKQELYIRGEIVVLIVIRSGSLQNPQLLAIPNHCKTPRT
jgi:hypothetical protein